MFEDFSRLLTSVPQLHSLAVQTFDPDFAFVEAHRWEAALPSHLLSFRFDLTITCPENLPHLELFLPFKSSFWLSRRWIVRCHLRDRGHYFRLFTVPSPISRILYWPDDEIRLDSDSAAAAAAAITIDYPKVTQLELWWNLSKPIQCLCSHVQSVQLYGANDDSDEPIHPDVDQILRSASLKHLIINENLPVSPMRFASALVRSSTRVNRLTCSWNWLHPIVDRKENEWICFLITMRIRQLTVMNNEIFHFNGALIAFCRTFVNVERLTMRLESLDDFLFIVNTLKQLVSLEIDLPCAILTMSTEINEWLREKSSLDNFVVHKQPITLETYKILLWIGSRRASAESEGNEGFDVKHPLIDEHLTQRST